jgi:hypothetical protein
MPKKRNNRFLHDQNGYSSLRASAARASLGSSKLWISNLKKSKVLIPPGSPLALRLQVFSARTLEVRTFER